MISMHQYSYEISESDKRHILCGQDIHLISKYSACQNNILGWNEFNIKSQKVGIWDNKTSCCINFSQFECSSLFLPLRDSKGKLDMNLNKEWKRQNTLELCKKQEQTP